jgi:predicted metal-dependent hydrolase
MKKIIIQKQIEIAGISILLLQKRIKNLHLRILPMTGEVRVSAPIRLSLKYIKKFIEQRVDWINDKQVEIKNRKIAKPPKFISNEIHNFFGESFELQLHENAASNKVEEDASILKMFLKNSSTTQQREKILDDFYRKNLLKKIPDLITKYEKKMNVKVAEFRIKKMKTRWGTCNIKERRIWLSLELAKKPLECLEFIVVHEMVHFFERKHGKKFYDLMNNFLPEWKKSDAILKNKQTSF